MTKKKEIQHHPLHMMIEIQNMQEEKDKLVIEWRKLSERIRHLGQKIPEKIRQMPLR